MARDGDTGDEGEEDDFKAAAFGAAAGVDTRCDPTAGRDKQAATATAKTRETGILKLLFHIWRDKAMRSAAQLINAVTEGQSNEQGAHDILRPV
jgi:hypothetical protein